MAVGSGTSRRACVAISSFCFGALVTLSLTRVLGIPAASVHNDVRTKSSSNIIISSSEALVWAALRPTACNGPAMGGVAIDIPGSASIGNFSGRPVQLLRTLGDRNGLANLANSLNLTGSAVELGVWRGEFAEHNLKAWNGRQYVLVDLWTPSDCVSGNRSHCVYGSNVSDGGVAERNFDKMITGLRMQRGGNRFKNPDGSPRWLMLQNSTLEAASAFADESFDWVYLDATHTYAEAKRDLEAWYPKVKLGGLVSGHDYQFQHQAIGDGYIFGVKDAIDEFAARRNMRVYSTSEPYLPSFYFLKCTKR